MTLLDEHASVVHRLSKTLLEHLCLKTALENLLCGKKKYGIQLLLFVGEEAKALELAEKSSAFENTLRVLDVKSHQFTGSLKESERIIRSAMLQDF